MRRVFINLALVFTALATSVSAADYQWTNERVDIAYGQLSLGERKEFHFNLMKVLEQKAKKTKYEQEKINVYLTQNNFYLLENLFNSAYATIEDPTIFCNFGGWMTNIKNGKCVAPWSRSVRDNPEMEIFGEGYKNSCGGANLFRCNPIIFGPGDDGKGICTTTDDSDPNLATSSCIDDFLKDHVAGMDHLISLQEDPKKLSAYIAIAAESMRSCEVSSTNFDYCKNLTWIMENTTKTVVQCMDVQNLISFLPDVITPFNQDEIDKITNGLGTKAVEYLEELEKKQEEARLFNRGILEQAITASVEDERMKDTITRIRDNTTECLRGLCKGTRYSKSKPKTKSIAKCAAYVKHALYPYPAEEGKRFANFSEYPWGKNADDAVEGGRWLKKLGFENILDYPEMAHLTPETAPPGAIIVYEKIRSGRTTTVDGVRRGAPGHIEIKASENEYISDFINDEPTRVGGMRRPIGIYYQIPDEYKKQLKEVPSEL